MATRYQIARRAWIASVTLDCSLLQHAKAEQVIPERIPDWLLCSERKAFIGLIFGE